MGVQRIIVDIHSRTPISWGRPSSKGDVFQKQLWQKRTFLGFVLHMSFLSPPLFIDPTPIGWRRCGVALEVSLTRALCHHGRGWSACKAEGWRYAFKWSHLNLPYWNIFLLIINLNNSSLLWILLFQSIKLLKIVDTIVISSNCLSRCCILVLYCNTLGFLYWYSHWPIQ